MPKTVLDPPQTVCTGQLLLATGASGAPQAASASAKDVAKSARSTSMPSRAATSMPDRCGCKGATSHVARRAGCKQGVTAAQRRVLRRPSSGHPKPKPKQAKQQEQADDVDHPVR